MQIQGLDTIDDNGLLHLAKQGKQSAMKAIYDRYVKYMSAIVARYIMSESDRKDVLQECFIKIFTSIHDFVPRHNDALKSWISRIVVNESLRFLKKNVMLSFIEYEDALPDIVDEPEIDGIPDDVINDFILSLPTGYRMVFNLYVFEHKSHREIAAMLDIKENSSASQYSRAKNLLAKKLKAYKNHNS
ncbi:MAG: RNA polymerase sigma factor [Prevotella sp.]